MLAPSTSSTARVLLRPPYCFSLTRRQYRCASFARALPPLSSASFPLRRRYASTTTTPTPPSKGDLPQRNSRERKKPYYITTPIFYPNAKPHIGHLYTLVLGDAFARFRRLVEPGRDVKLLVGTDEHGLKIQQAAQKAGVPEGEFVDGLSEVFRTLSSAASISHTLFARTSAPSHRAAVSRVWKILEEKGYVYRGLYEGWYSVTDECFWTGGQIEPTPETLHLPPSQQTFVAKETRSRVEWTKEYNYMFRLSAFREVLLRRYGSTSREGGTGETLVFPAQYNSVVLGMLGAFSSSPSPPSPLSPPPSSSLAEEKELLADISISRPRSRLTWGIPVPSDPEHTVYVWFDALLVYLSGVGGPWGSPVGTNRREGGGSTLTLTSTSTSTVEEVGEDVEGREGAGTTTESSPAARTPTPEEMEKRAGWPADLQIIGKDILRFHAIYLPAILLALSGPSYAELVASKPSSSVTLQPPSTNATPQLPSRLLTHAHWTVSSSKMSKSVGNVVDPILAMEKWGVDVVRWYMCRVGGRFRDDVDWSEEQLEKHSKELQSLLGNYLLRVTSPKIVKAAEVGRVELFSAHSIPSATATPNAHLGTQASGKYTFQHPLNEDLAKMAVALPRRVRENMERLEVGEAVERVVEVLKVANKTISDIAPWSKTCPPAVVFETRQVALLTLRVAGVCLGPYVPGTGARLLGAFGLSSGGGEGEGESKESSGGVKEGEEEEKKGEDVWERVEGVEERLGEEMRRVWDVKGVKLF